MNQQPPAHHDLTDGWMDGWMDGWTNEWMDDDQSEPKVTHAALWMDGWMNGWMMTKVNQKSPMQHYGWMVGE
jgi:hypothetical protein